VNEKARKTRGWLNGALIALAVLGALARVFTLDDAFISFRYAENFANGHGLVFNPGERVEGYTNFLWVMLLSPFARLGADLVLVSSVLGIGFFTGSLLLVASVSEQQRRLHEGSEASPLVQRLPSLALVGCACNSTFLSFATGGLETSLFTFLSLLALSLLNRAWTAPGPRTVVLFALTGVALSMTRPDGLLIFALFGCSLLLAVRRALGTWRPVLLLGGIVLATWLPYFLWRWSYYGWPFPNTFYAKNARDWQFERGVLYLQAFIASYPYVCAAVPLVLLSLVPRLRQRFLPGPLARPLFWTLALTVGLFMLYVAKVGGDFMEYRFMAPLLPMIFLLLELGVGATRVPTPWVLALGAAFSLTFVFHRPVLAPEPLMEPVDGLAMHIELQGWDEQGRRLRQLLPPGTVLATTAAGAIPYYAKLPTIDILGLTDEFVAHLPMPCTSEVTIGHCKLAPESYLRERRVNLIIEPAGPPLSFSRSWPEGPEDVLIRFEGDIAMTARYLTRTAELDALFTSNPDVKWGGASQPRPPTE
jgi:arabinofuranosyltransferase